MSGHEAFLGALAGGGFMYSLVNGYGVLHGVGMAVGQLLVGVVLLAVYYAARRLGGVVHAG